MRVEGGDQDSVQWDAQGSDARQERIFVSVRLRPLNAKEIQSNDFADWECIDNNTILFKNCLSERSMYPNAYTFDKVFGFDSSTKRVYEEAAKEVALSVLNGVNSSVFAYGQTSSGKTFTMGGITQYAVADIYDYIDRHKEREFVMKFSAMEIYNEHVRDLLSSDTGPLRLLDDHERGTVVERLIEEAVRDKSHLVELISVCEAQRQTGETSLNETSSRSHQILRLTIESSARQFGGGNSSVLAANVNFVDLAGSERTSQTLSTGARLKEGSHINRSLLTLGKVIRTLSKGRNGHVPYRDSKLTRILHNSLGGNARTAIICTMSPAHSHLEQSKNTLLFASCAKEVATNAQVNVVMSDKALVKHLRKELARLESELKTMNLVSTNKLDVTSVLKDKELQIEKMDREIKELSRQRDVAQSKVEELLQSNGNNQVYSQHPHDEGSHHQSSESREKISCLDDSSLTSDTSDYQRLDVDLATSESFQYLDEHPSFDLSSTHHTDHPLDNFDHNLLSIESSPQLLCHTTPDYVSSSDDQSHHGWQKTTDDQGSEDDCKEVRCIEVEEQSINRITELPEPEKIPPPPPIEEEDNEEMEKDEKEEEKEKEKEKESFTVAENEYTISFEKELHHSDAEYDALMKRIKDLQKTIDCLVNRNLMEHPSPQSTEPERLIRSRSCKVVLTTTGPTSPAFEKMVVHYRDQSFGGFEKEVVSGKPKGLPKSSDPNGASNGMLSRLGFTTCIRTAIMKEMQEDVIKYSDASDGSSIYSSSVAGTNEDGKPESDKHMGYETDSTVAEEKCWKQDQDSTTAEEEESKDSKSGESVGDDASFAMQVRDCMSEGAPGTEQSPLNWHEEFEIQRFKIIELWYACNIPLVHRTYFFLLFKGDPSDKLYIEVELRRLSFIKNWFSQGQKIVMDGQVFTPSSRCMST